MSTIVDPLQNLYLGTAKHVLKDVLLDRGIVSHCLLESLQDKMDQIMSPQDIGRIPPKKLLQILGDSLETNGRIGQNSIH